MEFPLTKSYVSTINPEHPVNENLRLHDLIREAQDKDVKGEIVNLQNNVRMSTAEILKKVSSIQICSKEYFFIFKKFLGLGSLW